jgi:hypothetical protein
MDLIFAAVAGLIALAGCDRDARDAVTKAGAEVARSVEGVKAVDNRLAVN